MRTKLLEGTKVYLATDNKTNQKVVVKMKTSVRKEFKILKSIEHPNVVKAYGLYQKSFGNYLVIEYVEGILFHDYITQYAPIKETSIRSILKSLTETLIDIESAFSIYNKDLTLRNIIIRPDLSICLIDMERIHLRLKVALNHYLGFVGFKGKKMLDSYPYFYPVRISLYLLHCMTYNFLRDRQRLHAEPGVTTRCMPYNFLRNRQPTETCRLIDEARTTGYSEDLLGLVEKASSPNYLNYYEKEQMHTLYEIFSNQ